MKLKDFLKQFEGLNPELEVYKWGRHRFSVEKIPDFHNVKSLFISDDKSMSKGYSDEKDSSYNKEVVVVL